MEREQIKPKLRFQVFERDGFTCQYCGRTPEQDEVVLNVDHTISVKNGGTNDIENLVTSCWDCNIGKGARSILKRTKTESDLQEELDLTHERLKQIKALNKKRQSIKKVKHAISVTETQWARDITDESFDERCYSEIQKLSSKYTKEVLTESLEIAYNKHIRNNFDSMPKFVAYVGGVARNLSLTDEQQQIFLMYNRDVFNSARMMHQTRKMILENSDLGIETHSEVIKRIVSTLEKHHSESFITREEARKYFPNVSFTVYKSGIGIQILVCDTIAMILEELNETLD